MSEAPSSAGVLNAMDEDEARATLTRCCGAGRWVEAMISRRPFASEEALYESARSTWATMERDDILEAFSHHPRIGADIEQLRAKFRDTASWSEGEQGGVKEASEQTLRDLRDANLEYERRFGFIFIVCATGKSAEEMLEILRGRMSNPADEELRVAAAEQAKITQLRLEKLR